MRSIFDSSRRAGGRSRDRRELRHAAPDVDVASDGPRRPRTARTPTSRRSSSTRRLVGNADQCRRFDPRHACIARRQVALTTATIVGMTETGSVDLGTFTQTPRYKADRRSRSAASSARAFATRRSAATCSRSTRRTRRSTASSSSPSRPTASAQRHGTRAHQHRRRAARCTIVVADERRQHPGGRRSQRRRARAASRRRRPHRHSRPGRSELADEARHDVRRRSTPALRGTSRSRPSRAFRSTRRCAAASPSRRPRVDVDRQPGSAAPVVGVRPLGERRAAARHAERAAEERVRRFGQRQGDRRRHRDRRPDHSRQHERGHSDATPSCCRRRSTRTCRQNVALNLPPSQQGKKLGITAFADRPGRTHRVRGAAHRRARRRATSPTRSIDSTLVVFGHTYPLPQPGHRSATSPSTRRAATSSCRTRRSTCSRCGRTRRRKGFAPNGIAVGSLPWGLFVSNNPDTLLVANSGGTNISRVFIGSSDAAALQEDLANRILTRNTYIFTDHECRRTRTPARSGSRRPARSATRIARSTSRSRRGGRIFYSTRPTPTRRRDHPLARSELPVPDPRQIWQYGNVHDGTDQTYALFNVDSIAHRRGAAVVARRRTRCSSGITRTASAPA